MSAGLRHSTIDRDPGRSHRQLSENARDTQEEIARRVVGRLLSVASYTATGSTASRIRIGAGVRPQGVVPVLIAPVYDAASSLVATPILNFVWDATTQSIDVYEPDGLTADTVYTFTFLVLEGA